jgi:hypothetical protein
VSAVEQLKFGLITTAPQFRCYGGTLYGIGLAYFNRIYKIDIAKYSQYLKIEGGYDDGKHTQIGDSQAIGETQRL